MKVNMRDWDAEYIKEPGTYRAVVTGSGEDVTKNGSPLFWISFAMDGKLPSWARRDRRARFTRVAAM